MDKNVIIGSHLSEETLDKMKLSVYQYLKEVTKPYVKLTATMNAYNEENETYKEIFQKSYQISNYLKELKCGKDTVIAIVCENRPENLSLFLGASEIGAICTFFWADYSATEIGHAFHVSQPKVVFTSNAALEKIEIIKSKHCSIINVINIDSDEWPNKYKTNIYQITESVSPTDTAVILFSSGSTGFPKGIRLSHRSLIYFMELERLEEFLPFLMESLSPGFSPLGHSTALLSMLFSFSTGQMYLPIKDYNEEIVTSVIRKYDYVAISGTILRKEAEEYVRRRMCHIEVIQWYGMTETLGPFIRTNLKQAIKYGSVGTLIPGMIAKVIDLHDKKVLGSFQEGELCLKGPAIMNGYCFNESNKNLGFDEDGWFHTGDIVYYDDDFYFFVVDRISQLIRNKCYEISPTEIEMVLLKHKSVKDVGVIGISDKHRDEFPRAYIVKAEGCDDVTEIELQQFVKERLSPWKCLGGGIIFVEKLPKTALGKIDRRKLRQWSLEEF